MTTFKDIDLDIPKEVSKKKKIKIYKAFIAENGGELQIDVNIDLFSLNQQEAIERVIRLSNDSYENKTIPVVVLTLPKEELYEKPLVDHGDVFTSGQTFSLTLKDKIYEIGLEMYLVVSYDVEINKDTEEKTIKNLVIEKTDLK